MPAVERKKRWTRLFASVTVLVLLQLTWWTFVFLRDVSAMAELRREQLKLQSIVPGAPVVWTEEKIASEQFHQSLMFLSESVFFAAMILLGLFLLYRALRAEERSRDIERNFIEIISHESRTPLTALKLRLEAALEKSGGDGTVPRDLELALAEVRRLGSIFDKTMSLNRMERQAFTLEPLALGSLVRDVTRRLEPFFRSKGAKVVLNMSEDPLVNGDPFGLQNSIQSVMENAVLYNPGPNREVSIELKCQDGRAVLGIADNGPGIPEGDRERLFERFFRGQTGRGVPGTGLGLYIAKHIVEAHHGVLRLSPGMGPGARFEIDLPISTEAG